MLKLLGLILSGAAFMLAISGCISCREYLAHPRYIVDQDEPVFCSHHRSALLTVTGFTEPKFAHVDEMQRNEMTRQAYRMYGGTVFECNPNCVPPNYSLLRHGRFTAPASITYCLKCEQAVAPYRNASNHTIERTADRPG
jgi:hypothetical protein